jgi:hypothetical protein
VSAHVVGLGWRSVVRITPDVEIDVVGQQLIVGHDRRVAWDLLEGAVRRHDLFDVLRQKEVLSTSR